MVRITVLIFRWQENKKGGTSPLIYIKPFELIFPL